MNFLYIMDSKKPFAAFTPGLAESMTREWSWVLCSKEFWKFPPSRHTFMLYTGLPAFEASLFQA